MTPRPSEPTVDVVIPAYNAAAYIGETIASVLHQTHRLVSVVVVNDGSTDDTCSIASAIDDPRVTVLTAANAGVSAARNRGIEAGTAELIAFLDADDYWFKHKLATQIQHLRSRPNLVAVGALMRYESATGSVLGTAGQEITELELAAIRQGLLMPFPLSSLVIRRVSVTTAGGFDEDLDRDVPGQVEDLDFLARVARTGPVDVIPEVLGAYRVHSDSATVKHYSSQLMGTRFVQARLASRARGEELVWTEFRSSYRLTIRERYHDRVRSWYRGAGLFAADRHWVRFVTFLALALIADPRYTLQRAFRQQRGRFRR